MKNMITVFLVVVVAFVCSVKSHASSCTGFRVSNECVPAENILDGTLGASVSWSGCGLTNLPQGVSITYGLTSATMTTTDTSATSLVVGGGITAGTGLVAIAGTNGKLAAFDTTHYSSLSGANFTNLPAAGIVAGALGAVAYSDVGSVAIATSATSAYSFTLKGAKTLAQLAVTVPGAVGEVYLIPDGTVDVLAISTQAVTASWLGNTESRAAGTSAH